MVGISSPDGTFQNVSPAFTENLGFSEKEFLTKPFIDFVHLLDKSATISKMNPLRRCIQLYDSKTDIYAKTVPINGLNGQPVVL